MRLSDNSIAQIVRLLQMALLTGTDVSDNLRTLELVLEGDNLDVDPKYLEVFESNLKKLQEEAEASQAEMSKKKAGFARSFN
jgi:hypothetical protein